MPLSTRGRPLLVLLGFCTFALSLIILFAGEASRSSAEQGQYLHFTGPDSGYIEVADAPALNPPMEITVEAWVFLTSGNGWGVDAEAEPGCPTFVGKNFTTSYWFGLNCNGDTSLSFYASPGISALSTGEVPIGEWAHVAASYDGLALKFYINGVLDTTVPMLGSMGSSTDPLRIGQDVEWDASPIGHIDEVHIWSEARSQAAVMADMEPITTPQINLVGVWNMEGTPNADIGGFTGTLVGDAELSGTPLTPSPSPEPAYVKGDTGCDHTLSPADALPLLARISSTTNSLPSCTNPVSLLSVQGVPDLWWDASSGEGYIEIPDNAELNPTDEITVELWVNVWSYLSPDNQNGCPSLVGKGYQSAWWLGICGGYPRFYSRGSSSSQDAEGQVPMREWVHLAVAADATSTKFYINGQLDSEFEADGSPLTTNSHPVRIGSDVNYDFQPWAALDDVRIYNIALTEAEIQGVMSNPPTFPATGLVANYSLDGNAEDIASDHEGGAVGTVEYGTTFPPPYWHDINCDGFLAGDDVLGLVAYLGGIGSDFPLPDGCEAIGTSTG